jgi:serine phosphatase RsbU (regulator of sigma subunit)
VSSNSVHRSETVRAVTWVAAGALLVFVLRITIPDAGRTGVGFLFMGPVGAAAWWFGRRGGLTAAALCLGLYAVSAGIVETDGFALSLVVRAAALVATALVVAELKVRGTMLAETESELDLLRQALTPNVAPALPGLEVGISFLPAEHKVSGDFYLLTNGLNGTNIAIVGDVTGHGLEAAQAATFARATLSTLAANSSDPDEILALANQTLADRWVSGERFVTATCVVHDPVTQTVRWSVGGHHPPVRISDQTDIRSSPGLPLGIDAQARFQVQQASLTPPDGLLLYTDGLIEARRNGELFGDARLREIVAAHGGESTADLVASIRSAVGVFAGERFADDICIVALRATPA